MATPSESNNLHQQHELPRIYLLLENPSKSNNLGSIIRCANAFGILTIVAIGYAQCSVYGTSFECAWCVLLCIRRVACSDHSVLLI